MTEDDIRANLAPACRAFLQQQDYEERLRMLLENDELTFIFEIIPNQRCTLQNVEDVLLHKDCEEEFMDITLALMLSGSASGQIDYAKFRKFYKMQIPPLSEFDYEKLAQRTLLYSIVDLLGKDRCDAASVANEFRKRSNGLRDFESFTQISKGTSSILQNIANDITLLSDLIDMMVDLGENDSWKLTNMTNIFEVFSYFGSKLGNAFYNFSLSSEGFYSRLSTQSKIRRNYFLAHFSDLVRDTVSPVSSLDFETCLCYTCDAVRFLDSSRGKVPAKQILRCVHNGVIQSVITCISKCVDLKKLSMSDPIHAALYLLCHELNSLNFSSLAYSIMNTCSNRLSDKSALFYLKLDIYLSEKKLREALLLCEDKHWKELPVRFLSNHMMFHLSKCYLFYLGSFVKTFCVIDYRNV